MKIACPACGRTTAPGKFCERCGAGIPHGDDDSKTEPPFSYSGPARSPPTQPPVRSVSVAERAATPVLEIDSICLLFENLPGILRFRLNSATASENVSIVLENPLVGVTAQSRNIACLQGIREITVPIPAQPAGAFVWYIALSYEASGRKHRLEGEVQMLVVRPFEAQKAADRLSVTITNNINNGNASDVHVSQRAVEELAHLARAENPFDELRRIVLGASRAWVSVAIDICGAMPVLPAPPGAAVRDALTLDIGTARLHFFAGRTIRLGRKRETNEISLRPPDGVPDEAYRTVSRAQCHFGHSGDKVFVCDGQMDDSHVVRPSSYGTYWNDRRIESAVEISAGETGVLSLSGTASSGSVALDMKACRPMRDCATCPHADRTWCGDGRRPALMLTRRDGVSERFVALWSCFPMEEADPSFEGVVIFRKDGGFAWRRGRRCGWLVPGETLNTDFGQVNVS